MGAGFLRTNHSQGTYGFSSPYREKTENGGPAKTRGLPGRAGIAFARKELPSAHRVIAPQSWKPRDRELRRDPPWPDSLQPAHGQGTGFATD